MQEITSKTVFVSAQGGTLDYVAEADGEVLFSVAVPAGRVNAAEYLELAPQGVRIEIADGLVALTPKSWYGVQAYGEGSHDSGANPDFAPTSASRMEKEMRLTLAKMQAQTARLEAREKALSLIERVPQAPAPAAKAEAQPEPEAKSEEQVVE